MPRGLVLGGGGITGIAWELGILAGLLRLGLDLGAADLVIGTSAGSVVGAQMTSGTPLEGLYAAQLEPPDKELGAAFSPWQMMRYAFAALLPGDAQAVSARLGRMALRASTVAEEARRKVMAERLPVHTWPERALKITVIAAETGEFRVLDKGSGVPLVDAVAASCAVPLVWPPMTLAGPAGSAGPVRYIDGGMRSPANADLATGCERVVVLAPLRRALRSSGRLSTQLASLGPSVRSVAVWPDTEARMRMGNNALDPAYRAAAAREGLRQAELVLERVRAVWA